MEEISPPSKLQRTRWYDHLDALNDSTHFEFKRTPVGTNEYRSFCRAILETSWSTRTGSFTSRTEQEEEIAFVSRLSSEDRLAYNEGRRLSVERRVSLLKQKSDGGNAYIEYHGLYFNDDARIRSEQELHVDLQNPPSPIKRGLKALLRDCWDFPEPLVLDHMAEGIREGFSLGVSKNFLRSCDIKTQDNYPRFKENFAIGMQKIIELQSSARASRWYEHHELVSMGITDFIVIPIDLVPKDQSDFRLVFDYSRLINPATILSPESTWRSFAGLQAAFTRTGGGLPGEKFISVFDAKRAFNLLCVRPEDLNLQLIAVPSLIDEGSKRYSFLWTLQLGNVIAGRRWEIFASLYMYAASKLVHRVTIARWVDDFINLHSTTREESIKDWLRLLKIAKRWNLPLHKLQAPAISARCLGLNWDLGDSTITLLAIKKAKYLARLKDFSSLSWFSLKDLNRVIGVLEYLIVLIPSAKPFVRHLRAIEHAADSKTNTRRENKKTLFHNDKSRLELKWWISILNKWGGKVNAGVKEKPSVRFFSDYSSLQSGGGGWFSLELVSWAFFQFSQEELIFLSTTKTLSSTRGELYVIACLLRTMGPSLSGKTVTIYTDSHPSVQIERKGWSKIPEIDSILKTIATISISYNIQTIFQHVPRELNAMADSIAKGDLQLFYHNVDRTFETPVKFATVSPETVYSPENRFWPHQRRFY